VKVSLPFFQLNQQATTTTTLLFIVDEERCKWDGQVSEKKKRKEEFLQFV